MLCQVGVGWFGFGWIQSSFLSVVLVEVSWIELYLAELSCVM